MIFVAHLAFLAMVVASPDGPGHHHHGAGHHGAGHHGDHSHGDHSAHHSDHGAHHGDHGTGHHADHGGQVQLGSHPAPGQHHAVHNAVQRPVSASFSIQPETNRQKGESHQPLTKVVTKTVTPPTLGDIIRSHPKLTTLNKAISAAGLEATLSSPGPLTVFAPTDLAFSKIPQADMDKLLSDREAIKKVLLRHVLTGQSMQGKNIPPGTTIITTAGGEKVSTTRDKFIQIKSSNSSAYIVLFDVLGSNGVLHALDPPL